MVEEATSLRRFQSELVLNEGLISLEPYLILEDPTKELALQEVIGRLGFFASRERVRVLVYPTVLSVCYSHRERGKEFLLRHRYSVSFARLR